MRLFPTIAGAGSDSSDRGKGDGVGWGEGVEFLGLAERGNVVHPKGTGSSKLGCGRCGTSASSGDVDSRLRQEGTACVERYYLQYIYGEKSLKKKF